MKKYIALALVFGVVVITGVYFNQNAPITEARFSQEAFDYAEMCEYKTMYNIVSNNTDIDYKNNYVVGWHSTGSTCVFAYNSFEEGRKQFLDGNLNASMDKKIAKACREFADNKDVVVIIVTDDFGLVPGTGWKCTGDE